MIIYTIGSDYIIQIMDVPAVVFREYSAVLAQVITVKMYVAIVDSIGNGKMAQLWDS